MQQLFEQTPEQQPQAVNRFSSAWEKGGALLIDFLMTMANGIIRLRYTKHTDAELHMTTGAAGPWLAKVTVKTGWLIMMISCSAIATYGQASVKGNITDRQQNLPFA